MNIQLENHEKWLCSLEEFSVKFLINLKEKKIQLVLMPIWFHHFFPSTMIIW